MACHAATWPTVIAPNTMSATAPIGFRSRVNGWRCRIAPSSATAAIRLARQWCGMCITAAASSSIASCRRMPCKSPEQRRQSWRPEQRGDIMLEDHLGRAALTTLATGDLATIYPDPTPRVIAKARPEIDAHAKRFIAMSPFCVLATSGSDGSVDASPRGGNPGFIHVEGPNRLLMPDRSGNNRIDSFRNIVEGSGLLQLIFF